MILGIDPGQNRGYALIDETEELERLWGLRCGRILATGKTLDDIVAAYPGGPVRIICEYQYGGRIFTGEVRARDVIKLAFRAGFACCEAMTVFDVTEAVAIRPQAWKGALFRNGGQVVKNVYTNRLEKLLTRPERRLVPKNTKGKLLPDPLDAIGLAWALPYLTEAQLVVGRVTFDQVLPKGSN